MKFKNNLANLVGFAVLGALNAFAQQTFTSKITYDELGQVQEFEYPNGCRIDYAYNNEVGIPSSVLKCRLSGRLPKPHLRGGYYP